MTFLRGRTRHDLYVASSYSSWGGQGSDEAETRSTHIQLSITDSWERVRPHLHLDVGVGKVVLRRQLAVIVDEVVQDGGAQDGLEQGREDAVGEGLGVQGPRGHGYRSHIH